MQENQELFRSSRNTSQDRGPSSSKSTQSLKDQREGSDRQETSEEWLEARSLESCGLTLSHLRSRSSTARVEDEKDKEDEEDAPLEMDAETLADFEMQLYRMIEMFHSRIQWLTRGSKKIFGMVPGSRLGVLVDVSDASCSNERLADLQRHLLLLVQEQLHMKKQLHVMSVGTQVSSLWEKPRVVNRIRLQEVQEWILRLSPSGDCNLLQALEETRVHHHHHHHHLDSLLIILSSCPDQDVDVLLSYMSEMLQDTSLCLHVVALCSCSPALIETVKEMSKVTNGRFHIFTAALGVVDSSSDLDLLWAEIKSARNVLQHIQKARQHRALNHTHMSIVSEDLDALSLSDPNSDAHAAVHGADLCVRPAGRLPSTSAEWLQTHGLKAKKLNLYHVLSPNIYTPLEGFVPILRKSVQSKVHQNAAVRFQWHDGTLKNVHVDLPLLQSYQRRLLEAEQVLEDRVTWLNAFSSRQIWGTVCEQSVQVVLDMSDSSDRHMRHAVRLLLEEQLQNTRRFNIVAFGGDVKAWRERAVSSNHQNLQDAWRWVQELECSGGRNTPAALRYAASEPQDSSLTRGVYLLTTGAPDQDGSALLSCVSEFCTAVRVHVCLFSREIEPLRCSASRHVTRVQAAAILRDVAHSANGRFHWITDTGIVESDDITILIREMERAADYWQKCCELMDSVLDSSRADSEEAHVEECRVSAQCTKPRTQKRTLPPPRETRLTSARLGRTEVKPSAVWRPNSAKADVPPGSVLKANGARKRFNIKHEDVSSSKQWLRRFGIRNLNLDLHKLLSVPACTHRTQLVPVVSRSVSAKYCTIFPSVHLNGRELHLLLSAGELKQYLIQTRHVLHSYTLRMQWLLSGSRLVFGCVLERDVCIVLDVSGSMFPHFTQLYTHLTSLIWDQLHLYRVRFSMVVFSEVVQVWQDELVEASEEKCRDAVTWLSQINTHGGSSILHALQAACVFGESLGVYVVSDGRWDCSHSLILKEVERLTSHKHITIHTVAPSEQDSTGTFLKSLAHQTGGRFHQIPPPAAVSAATELLSRRFSADEDSFLPEFQGDDLRTLRNETEKLRTFRKQAGNFREMLLVKNPGVRNPK